MDSNIVFDDLGTFKLLTKSGPLDPLFTTKILVNIQGNAEPIFKNTTVAYLNILEIQHFENFGKCGTPNTNKLFDFWWVQKNLQSRQILTNDSGILTNL